MAGDPALASNRDTGGEHTDLTGDRGSVTGTGRTEEFVGRIAGDDLGYAGRPVPSAAPRPRPPTTTTDPPRDDPAARERIVAVCAILR